jgi:hypothetical protein
MPRVATNTFSPFKMRHMQIRVFYVLYVSVSVCKYVHYTYYVYPNRRIICIRIHMQIRVLYISYVCKYADYPSPYPYANTCIIHIIRTQIYGLSVSVSVNKCVYYTYNMYANTRIIRIRIRMQIRVLYILYVCKYANYPYPYPDTEYAGGNPTHTSWSELLIGLDLTLQ